MIDKNRQTRKHKWDRQSLNQKEKISQYQEKIQSKLQEMREKTDINQDRQNLKQMIIEAASESNYLKIQRMLTTGGTMNVREQFRKRMKQEKMLSKKNKSKSG
jgi:hypothetical protein